jgi:hypothetical protein
MEIEIEINRKDFVKFNQYYMKHRKSLMQKFYPIALVVLVILLNLKRISDISYMVGNIIFVLIIYYIAILILKPLIALRIKNMPSEKGGILGKRKLTISDDGLIETTEHSESITKWGGVHSVETTKNYVYVFVDSCAAHIIPTRYFNSPDEVTNFCAVLKSRVENAKK